MSAPGKLTAAELSTFTSGGRTFRLNNVAAAWWHEYSDALVRAFGFAPVLTYKDGRPSGGYRTAADQMAINPGYPVSASAHCMGNGHDIYNQAAFRSRDEALFLRISHQYGLIFPYSWELWHAEQTFRAAPATTAPAGGSGATITPTESSIMFIFRSSSHKGDILIRPGFAQFSRMPDRTNQAAALWDIPIRTNESFLTSALAVAGVADLGTLIANEGVWIPLRSR